MASRTYRLGRRAQTAEKTRRRIVEATHALHSERGVAATTMAEIAARAGVSIGSLYHHFPTYDDAITACGQYSLQRSPLPDGTVFAGASSRRQRIERLTAAVFTFYERLPGIDRVRRDRDSFAPLGAFFDAEERQRMGLAADAIGSEAIDPAAAATVAALLDLSVYSALRRSGLDSAGAAGRIADVIIAWLAAPGRPRRAGPAR